MRKLHTRAIICVFDEERLSKHSESLLILPSQWLFVVRVVGHERHGGSRYVCEFHVDLDDAAHDEVGEMNFDGGECGRVWILAAYVETTANHLYQLRVTG
jgi:hypothetical protein